jgi:hypothetical protein
LLKYAIAHLRFVIDYQFSILEQSKFMLLAHAYMEIKLGAFIPAEYGAFRLTDQIFARIGSDELDANCSTFMVECQEINYILQVEYVCLNEA